MLWRGRVPDDQEETYRHIRNKFSSHPRSIVTLSIRRSNGYREPVEYFQVRAISG
jgi:hypothetical protein